MTDAIDELERLHAAATMRLLDIGASMSNVCFNVGQPAYGAISDHDRRIMSKLSKDWDAAYCELRRLDAAHARLNGGK